MPNIYYCHSISQGSGMLRAVLSCEEADNLMKLQAAHYVGMQFPENQRVDFAVLCMFEGEPREERPAGFYRFDAEINDIEKAIRVCTAKPKS
jgi:hypothetical protein